MSLKIGKDIVLPDFSPSAPGNWGKAVIQLCQQFDAAFLLREVRSSDPNAPKFQPLGSSSNQGTQSQSAMAQSPSSPKRSNTQSSLIQDVTPKRSGSQSSSSSSSDAAEAAKLVSVKTEPGYNTPVTIGRVNINATNSLVSDSDKSQDMIRFVDQMLEQELDKNVNFYVRLDDGTVQVEPPQDRQKRLLVWGKVIQSLASHTYLYNDLKVGDVRSVYYRANIIAQRSNHERASILLPKLVNYNKPEKVGFQDWYNQMNIMFNELDVMGAKLPTLLQIAILCRCLSSDKRYKAKADSILSKGYNDLGQVAAILAQKAIELDNVATSNTRVQANFAANAREIEPCYLHALGLCSNKNCKRRHKGVSKADVPQRFIEMQKKRIAQLERKKGRPRPKPSDSDRNVPPPRKPKNKGKGDGDEFPDVTKPQGICFVYQQNGSCPGAINATTSM